MLEFLEQCTETGMYLDIVLLPLGGGGLMSLEMDVTREKLQMLETRYEAEKREQGGDAHVRELSMRSLKRLINQLKEEIARSESRVAQKTKSH